MNSELESRLMELISNVGMAKTKYMEAIQKAKKGEYEESDREVEEGNNFLLQGHKIHATLIQQEAEGLLDNVSLFVVHAEDQLMSAETIKMLVQEFTYIYKELNRSSEN